MADQKRWWKLWHSALSDDAVISLPPALRWAWAALGAHTKVHGTRGKVQISPTNDVLAAQMGVPVVDIMTSIKLLPHVSVEEGKNHHGEFTVTWKNWVKYQEDSTQAERQRASRSKRRGEEKRREENKQPPIVPHGGTLGFENFWTRYPRKVAKKSALKAWAKIAPSNGLQETILTALMLQASSEAWTKDNGQFVPHPATWLNGKRWEDEVSPPTTNLPRATQQTLEAVKQFRSGGHDG